MAILTLTPSRFAAATDFPVGAYAYVYADRPVRKLGVLITPEPVIMQINTAGETMTADLTPNVEVDEEEDFLYTISVFDADGLRMYNANFVMPETDSAIFDIIPVTQDLNSCETTTVRDNSV